MELFEYLPNFMILGAAKAGTTTLFNLLKQHPQVYLPFNKEPMYFSQDENYLRGARWYARTYFRKGKGYLARGEATPHYLYWSDKVAGRIQETYQQHDIKFILIFRDPVKRAYSWYWNMIKEGRENLPFESALQQESQRLEENHEKLKNAGSMTYGYIRGSNYASALQPFLELFPRQDFHFLLQEDLELNFPHTVHNTLEFLSLDASIALKPVRSNLATMPRSSYVQGWLRRQTGFRRLLAWFFPYKLRHAIKSSLLQANARVVEYPKLDPALESELRLRFAPEVRQLEKIIDRDLSAWLPQ